MVKISREKVHKNQSNFESSVADNDSVESVQFTLELLTKLAVEEDIQGLTPTEAIYRRNRGMHTAESTAHAATHKPRANDVFISTYPKCGTLVYTILRLIAPLASFLIKICNVLKLGQTPNTTTAAIAIMGTSS